MLANSFNRNSYKLIICPPVLVDYCRSVLQEFDVSRCDVESLGKLDKLIHKNILTSISMFLWMRRTDSATATQTVSPNSIRFAVAKK